MAVGASHDFTKDPELIPGALAKGDERDSFQVYVRARIAKLLQDNASWRDSVNPAVPSSAKTQTVVNQIKGEITQAVAAYNAVKTHFDNHPERLVDISGADKRVRLNSTSEPTDTRPRLIRQVAWGALANDPTLLVAANVDQLKFVAERRMRAVEWMRWHVGKAAGRTFKIGSNGEWTDGLKRPFEYPRVPRAEPFKTICNAAQGANTCAANSTMAGWTFSPDESANGAQYQGPVALRTTMYPAWDGPNSDYYFYFTPPGQTPPPWTVETVIDGLFAPLANETPDFRLDFRTRNHLNCDQVISCIHMESLLSPLRARSQQAQLETLAQTQYWLQIGSSDPGREGTGHQAKFLAGKTEPSWFQHVQVHPDQLEVGDHVIVHNHPAYDAANIYSHHAWRLENALVVETHPKLLMQGHGIVAQTIDDMRSTMLGLFKAELAELRGLVQGRAAGSTADIPVPGRPVWMPSKIVHRTAANSPTLAQGAKWTPPTYTPSGNLGDWWLQWDVIPSKAEDYTLDNHDRAQAAHDHQHVDYYFTGGSQIGVGMFPLYDRKGRPFEVTTDMIAAWTWNAEVAPATRDHVWAIKPKSVK